MYRIIIVCGKICSGKDTFAQNLVFHTPIDIGSIVRRIVKQEVRVHDKTLDEQIINELDDLLSKEGEHIITGIRQTSILKALLERKEKIGLVWLEVPDEELKRRFINRNDKKDNLCFEEAIQRDEELGLGEVEEYLKKLPQIKIINNY